MSGILGSVYTLSASEAPSMTSQFSTAMNSIQSDVFAYLAIGIPVALAIVGAFFGIKKGVKFFMSLANKG